MREIKFRGKRKDTDWKYGYYYAQDASYSRGEAHYIRPLDEQYISYGVDPESVGEFTGLKDKNGKEIYEGDICKHTNGQVEVNSVEYYVGEWHLEPHDLYLSDEYGEVEVIGNIYENLLKEEDKLQDK